MRRRKLLVALAALAVVVAAGMVILWFVIVDPSAELTRPNVTRMKAGMTLPDLTLLLGPPGDHRTANTEPDPNSYGLEYPRSFPPGQTSAVPRSDSPKLVVWRTDGADLHVWLNDSGQAYRWEYSPMWIRNESPGDRLVRETKRRWHRWFP